LEVAPGNLGFLNARSSPEQVLLAVDEAEEPLLSSFLT
jgi:hypothetical protein